jgi:hypothetical protein
MRKMTGIHVLLGCTTAMVACSVKSDGLALIDAGRSATEAGGGSGGGDGRATPLPLGTGGADTLGGTGGSAVTPGSGGSPVSPPGTGGVPPGTGGTSAAAPAGGGGPGSGGQVLPAGSGGGVSMGAAPGVGPGGNGGAVDPGAGGGHTEGTGGEGSGGKRDPGGTGGGAMMSEGSGGHAGDPTDGSRDGPSECSSIPVPPVAPGACAQGPVALVCVESSTRPGSWSWEVTCPGQGDGGRPGNIGGPMCGTSSDCPAPEMCTTEDGVCNPPPGCQPGQFRPCLGSCYGTCRPRGTGPAANPCQSDGDCRAVADTCMGCSCVALGPGQPGASCSGPGVRCFQDPCGGKRARCQQGSCMIGP